MISPLTSSCVPITHHVGNFPFPCTIKFTANSAGDARYSTPPYVNSVPKWNIVTRGREKIVSILPNLPPGKEEGIPVLHARLRQPSVHEDNDDDGGDRSSSSSHSRSPTPYTAAQARNHLLSQAAEHSSGGNFLHCCQSRKVTFSLEVLPCAAKNPRTATYTHSSFSNPLFGLM